MIVPNMTANRSAPTAVEYLKTLLSVVGIYAVTALTISVVILMLRVDLAAELLRYLISPQ
jgi:hypothetical protein